MANNDDLNADDVLNEANEILNEANMWSGLRRFNQLIEQRNRIERVTRSVLKREAELNYSDARALKNQKLRLKKAAKSMDRLIKVHTAEQRRDAKVAKMESGYLTEGELQEFRENGVTYVVKDGVVYIPNQTDMSGAGKVFLGFIIVSIMGIIICFALSVLGDQIWPVLQAVGIIQ